MKIKDERKQRIRDVKAAIAKSNQELLDKLTGAETAKDKAALKDAIALSKADRKTLEEELKKLRDNKLGSKFFEFTPHTGGNRRQAKQFKHSKRRNGATGSNKGKRIVGRRSN